MLKDLVYTCRSYRRFDENVRIPVETLRDWVESARCVASSVNSQVLRYTIVSSEEACAQVFNCCAWASGLPQWDGPEPGEQPSAYIVMASDQHATISGKCTAWDTGIAAQTILLRATEEGFGGCMIGAFRKSAVADICDLPRSCTPELVIALGKPVEDVRLVGPRENGSLTYYNDESGVHYVPKRPLSEVLLGEL